MNNDINREISIETNEINIDIKKEEYSIEINPTESYSISLNEQGPQGLRGFTGNGIESYVKTSSSGLTDTYTITFTDGNTTTVDVSNGKGIVSIEKTSTLGPFDTYTITYNDNTISTFTVTNGIDGVNPTITVGTTVTGNPGTSASVVNNGTTQDVVLDFIIPKGDKGDKGDKGEQGTQGPIGPQGISVTGVEEISKVGLVSTYRMYFSDGTHFDYQVTDGSVDGITREQIVSLLGFEPASYTSVEGLTTRVSTLEQRVEDLTVSKFPNVIIIGTPNIEGGQVSNFSDSNYLQFPFVDISRGLPFDIYFSFTTTDDITTQQNVLDSYFGIALAVQNGKGVISLSSNGNSWDIGTATGTNTLLPNTTYYAKCSWTGTEYNASLSLDDRTYIPDMVLASDKSPYKTTIFIGGSPNLFGPASAHPFKGTINFNKSKVVVNGITVWEGMADIGLASRANVSLNNLDDVGEARFDAKQDTLVSGTNIKTLNGNSILGSGDIAIQSAPDIDELSITTNSGNELQTIGIIDQNNMTNAIKTWTGTKTQYDAIVTKDSNTLYNITDDSDVTFQLLELIYPVGSIYIGTMSVCPLQTLGLGTWQLVAEDRVLQGAGTRGSVDTTIEAGLPNITGYGSGNVIPNTEETTYYGALYKYTSGDSYGNTWNNGFNRYNIGFDASRSSSIYGKSSTVQPPAYIVNIWKRIS